MWSETRGNHLKRFYEEQATWAKFWASPRELILAENILSELPKNKLNVLEVGFGDGYLSFLMKRAGHKVVGIDISSARAKNASKNVSSVHFILAEAKALPFPPETFDVVICAETLEHIPHFEKAIKEASSVLKSNGYYLVTVPFRDDEFKVTCPHCLKTFHPDGHLNFFTEESLMKSMWRGEFKVRKIYGFGSQIVHNKFIWRFLRLRSLRRLVDKLAQKTLEIRPQWIMGVAEKK